MGAVNRGKRPDSQYETPVRIVLLQAVITMAAAVGFAVIDLSEALAALAAGGVAVAANGWFAWRLARSRSAARIVVLAAERSILMGLLLCLVIVGLKPALVGFLATFALVHVAYFWRHPSAAA